jgi:hypothetical protein
VDPIPLLTSPLKGEEIILGRDACSLVPSFPHSLIP